MGGIEGQPFTVIQESFFQKEKAFLFFYPFPEGWGEKILLSRLEMLGQEFAAFSRIAGGGSSGHPMGLIHIYGY